jgi:excisionase family DNA binding protein
MQLANDAEICALYQQGLPLKGVATRLNIGECEVRKALARCNVARRAVGVVSPATLLERELRLAQGAALYMSGKSLRFAQDRVRIHAPAIRNAVIRFGGALREVRRGGDVERAAAVARSKAHAETRAAQRAAKALREQSKRPPLRISVALIRKLYEEDKLHPHQIAAQLGVDRSVIVLRLKRAGVKLRTKREVAALRAPKVDLRCLRKLYEEDQLPIKQVAKELGVSYGRIWLLMQRHGIQPRTSGEGALAALIANGTTKRGNGYYSRICASELKRLYVDERLTLTQCAERLGVVPSTVCTRLRKLGIATRTKRESADAFYEKKYPKVTRTILVRLYQDDGLTIDQVAERLGIHRSRVLRLLKRYSIPSRRSGWTPYAASRYSINVDMNVLKSDYEIGRMTTAALARKHGVSQTWIRKTLRQNGVEMRSPHRFQKSCSKAA